MSFTEHLVNFIVNFIGTTGYPSIFVLMSLESMVAPVPSEAVMPFAGFLVHSGRFSFTGVIFFSTLGSIFGSFISYYIGYWGGRPVVERFGKYLLLDKKDLDITERFFQKRGDITIFISRFIPLVRHLISIPAGIAKMNILKFIIYTIIGAGLWNAFLTYMGYILKDNWKEIMKYSHVVDIVVLVLMIVFVFYYIYKFYSNHKERKAGKDVVS
jgi:membrane protein DedA with SNARE-associated domain